jgi:precorrin-2 dehydrogenase / sirohydrochlorin ferrochelatase
LIVDLNLKGKLIIIVGGGNEALKKVNSLLSQDCKILLVSNSVNSHIQNYIKKKKIDFKKIKLVNADFLKKYKPHMVLATTNDRDLNSKIVKQAKKLKCYAYASDSPQVSDFAFGSLINIEDTVQIGIFTGGRSPVMAKKLKLQAEKIFKKLIKKEDIYHIKLQEFARKAAKSKIPTPEGRRDFLYSVMTDNNVKQLIQDGNLKKAQKRVMDIIGDLI